MQTFHYWRRLETALSALVSEQSKPSRGISTYTIALNKLRLKGTQSSCLTNSVECWSVEDSTSRNLIAGRYWKPSLCRNEPKRWNTWIRKIIRMHCPSKVGLVSSETSKQTNSSSRSSSRTSHRRRVGLPSVVSTVYDQFGFVCPFILSAKGILQDLCRRIFG